MSQSNTKKLRQFYRRDVREKLLSQINETPALLAQHIKPKPRWMPNRVYHLCMRVVLK